MDKLTVSLPEGFAPGTPVLVAYSGGADSSLLLHLLHERTKQTGTPLYAVHVHHGIRGAQADADLDFCRQTCRALGVPFLAVKVNTPALAKRTGKSTELAARDARYRHFARLMRKYGIPLLATAHHADDNLETLIFRLCRGTGTAGMRGIPAFSALPGDDASDLYVFRPFLHLTKKEILAACADRGLRYVTDATNACDNYARNRIRNRITPELEKLFDNPGRAAARLCRAAAEDCEALDRIADTLYHEHASRNAISAELLRSQEIALTKRILSLLYGNFVTLDSTQQPPMLEAVHLDALCSHIYTRRLGTVSLPGDIVAIIDRDLLRMTAKSRRPTPAPYCVPLQPGLTEIRTAGVAVWSQFPENTETVTASCTNVYNLYTELQVRFDTIKGAVFLRPIRESDVILSGGMHKKIRKLYGGSGVPLALRSRLPLLCDSDGVLAVPGLRIRDGSAAHTGHPTLCIRIYIKNNLDT